MMPFFMLNTVTDAAERILAAGIDQRIQSIRQPFDPGLRDRRSRAPDPGLCFCHSAAGPIGKIIPGFKNAFCIRAFVVSDKTGLCLLCLVFQSAI
jgi:hypothetical protein